MSPKSKESILLMSRQRIERTLNRMAYQIVEDNPEPSKMLIVGLKKRGFSIAQMLSDFLSDLLRKKVPCVQLKNVAGNSAKFDKITPGNNEKKVDYILLVDDVIFSGQTMLTAIQKIGEMYTPARLRTVVLIDRGHRTMPVEATFYGMKLPTKLKEHVSVFAKGNKAQKVILENGVR